MARLKDRNGQIPGGYRFRQPETGWKSPPWPSFDTLVKMVIQHRKGNPWQTAKYKWPTDYETVAIEVDSYNAQVCIDGGYRQYIQTLPGDSGAPGVPKSVPSPEPRGAVSRAAVGVAVLKSWFGEGGHPVSKQQSEFRASICVQCPKNGNGDWTSYFTKPASELIRRQIGVANDMGLTTTQDKNLNVCEACGCPLKLKVHTPIKHIMAETTPEDRAELNQEKPRCWILTEATP